MGHLRARALTILEYVKSTDTAFPYHRDPRKGIDVPKEERDALFESLYDQPGYGIWLSGFRDLLLNKQSNDFLAEFITDKIRARVKNPAVAEKLITKENPFGGKRVPLETHYYETYNKQSIHLVDIQEHPNKETKTKRITTAEGVTKH